MIPGGNLRCAPQDLIGQVKRSGFKKMAEWLLAVLFFVAYIVLMRWVLPRLGVPT